MLSALSSAKRKACAAAMIESTRGLLTLRRARDNEDDSAFFFALFAATRAAEMAAMPIDAKAKDFLLRVQHRSMTQTYRREYPNARWEVIELDGAPVGRLVTDVGEACVTYVDIALLPEAQGQGLARRIMLKALEEPRRLGLSARVSVLMQNLASLRLCERLGFVRVEESPPFVRLEWTG
jgi:GNAT superfamily N-acetyltransferase